MTEARRGGPARAAYGARLCRRRMAPGRLGGRVRWWSSSSALCSRPLAERQSRPDHLLVGGGEAVEHGQGVGDGGQRRAELVGEGRQLAILLLVGLDDLAVPARAVPVRRPAGAGGTLRRWRSRPCCPSRSARCSTRVRASRARSVACSPTRGCGWPLCCRSYCRCGCAKSAKWPHARSQGLDRETVVLVGEPRSEAAGDVHHAGRFRLGGRIDDEEDRPLLRVLQVLLLVPALGSHVGQD